MVMNEVPEVEDKTAKVMEALDVTVAKLKLWVPQAMAELGATPEQISTVRTGMDHDTLLYVPKIRDLLKEHAAPWAKRDIIFFRAMFPPEFSNLILTEPIVAKGFIYVEIFESLLKDLDSA